MKKRSMVEQGRHLRGRNILLIPFVSCLFIGFLPFMPGTFGSLFGCGVMFLFAGFFSDVKNMVAAVLVLGVLGILAVNAMRLGSEDPGFVVIDEMAGMFVTMAGHPITLTTLGIGFVLFRIFDIVKPYPVGRAERLSGGLGVMADDVVAGIFGSALLFAWEAIT